MAELTFKSAGVSLREIDLSGPTQVAPSGVPAGVVGTSLRGPAFVPITVGTYQDFVSVFGNTDGEKFGPLAVREWLKNAGSATYVRVLGVGDGKTRTATGKVTNSGFVVGAEQVQATGLVGRNPYNATAGASSGEPGSLGRTYFLTALMSESNSTTTLSSVGIQTGPAAVPILRGILMAPSGVVLALSANLSGVVNNTPAANALAYNAFGASGAGNAGANIGSVDTSSAKQEFVFLINGLKESESYKNIITASFDPKAGNYFANLFNTDPTKIEPAGHYLYAHYDVAPALATVTGTGVTLANTTYDGKGPFALLLTSSVSRNAGTVTTAQSIGAPNFEGFEDRFSSAFSPFVVSQKFGGVNADLFRFHSLTDGSAGSQEFKVTIENIQASTNAANKYGTFDVLIRKFDDIDIAPVVLEAFRGLTLDSTSDRYIGKVIGDLHSFFDFDQPIGRQRFVVEGDYANVSQFVRVELSTALKDGSVDPLALPSGFRGLYHLVTSGTTVATVGSILTGSLVSQDSAKPHSPSAAANITSDVIKAVTQPAVPLRKNLATGVSPKVIVQPALTWGVQFELDDTPGEPNKNQLIDASVLSFCKYFPKYDLVNQPSFVGDNAGTTDVGGSVLDADRFNRNFFSLERVEVITGSTDRPDPTQWAAAQYRRNAVAAGTLTNVDGVSKGSRLIDPAKDFGHLPSRQYLKFTFPMQGGFDGLNIFDKEKFALTNVAAAREMIDTTNQFGVLGSTVAAYRKAIDVLKNTTDADIQLLAIPGMRDPGVTDYAIDAVEKRFDAMFIMDIEQKDNVATVVTSSAQNVSVSNTVSDFQSRGLDTSFAAAYFPDVVITDVTTQTQVQCPPSVAVLGAFALNDTIGYPWFAPAGFARGALSSVLETQVKLNQSNLDMLYSADINPITRFPGSPSPVVFGQKTLQAAQSALDRVNVRRLLIDIRRKVRAVANTFVFEPNRASTLAAFSAKVTPILASVQQQQGLDRFSVKIDTTTTTQADVENNLIRGKIWLQPTKSVEFISLDFAVTNAGTQV